MGIFEVLAVNAAIVSLCFSALWLVALRLRDVSFIDSWWALGLVLTATATWLAVRPQGVRPALLLVLCSVWGGRLGIYLWLRWRRSGADRRYGAILGKAQADRGWSFARASLLLVFALQAPLQFIVSLPVQLGQFGTGEPGFLGWTGAALAAFGILFESLGDLQLSRFKRDPSNAGRVLDSGLWRYTRHPNYFGDACVWWGLFLLALEAPYGILALPGPILLTVLLTRWSGVPLVERHMKRKRTGYDDYIARTSGFVPWWPLRPD